MESKRTYRAIVVGQYGAGKSQFCNFVQRDITNSINKVSDFLDSCTQEPKSNYFVRNKTNYEFIDTAGNSDSENNNEKNLEILVNYLKEKKTIDYIVLILKFGERITYETRNYLKTLGKLFTPNEFFSHLCIFFTKFPKNPSLKENKIQKKYIEEINKFLIEIFNLNKNTPIFDVNVYFIDTEYDEDLKDYEKKFQDTIDIMMERMKLDIEIYNSINTENLDITGNNIKMKNEKYKKQIEELQKKLKEEKLRKEREEKERKILEKELKQERKFNVVKEKRLRELKRAKEEERKKIEEIKKKNDEIERRKKKIEEEANKKGITIKKLDSIIDSSPDTSIFTGLMSISCVLLGIGGFLISDICPIAGPLIASDSFKGCALSFLVTFGFLAGFAKGAIE